jgi:hypothetical protein
MLRSEDAEAEHATTLKNDFKVVLAKVPYQTGEKHKTALFSDALGLNRTVRQAVRYVNYCLGVSCVRYVFYVLLSTTMDKMHGGG